ncbi:4-(cytidine 5'-diphospho)-2-C-methyl-D-erythritol kinase [bacterium]|nr:4-(cytidine 5'-diphospho)-2-C-methyl-D-erythritol kinase [bacterium]
MKEVKVQAPAKINLTLEIVGKRVDGFHDLKSIMHTISLYDYLTVRIEQAENLIIELSGTSDEIPYDEKNLIWKAAEKFFEASKINNVKLSVYLEKNIPVQAGLAGGSSDAAATLFALNHLFENILSNEQINQICAELGSDLNFCLKGGCAICSSRGEKVRSIPFLELPVSIVKPKCIKISAKEAFEEYDLLENKETLNNTEKMLNLILRGQFDESLINNDLETPMRKKYHPVNNMKVFLKNSYMSGSGAIFYTLTPNLDVIFEPDEFIFFENLKTIKDGVKIVEENNV